MFARPSFASLYLVVRSGVHDLATATGFVVVRDSLAFLVTNRHVVRGRHNSTGKILDSSGALPEAIEIHYRTAGVPLGWTRRVEPLLGDRGPRWHEHPRFGGKIDVVALPLTDVEGTRLFPYEPQNPGRPIPYNMGGALSIVGFPFGIQGDIGSAVWVKGFVATEPSLDFQGLPRFLVDARTRPGQSGAPVLVYQHQGSIDFGDHRLRELAYPVEYFVGVYSGRVHPESDLGSVWKAAAVAEIVNEAVSFAGPSV